MLVAEKICSVDRSDNKYIYNPYGTAPTTTIQSLAGTYSISTYTNTNDTLTVQDEFVSAEHVYDFEQTLSNFDLFASRTEELTASVATAIDSYVLNNLCEDGTGTYDTPSGGFTTAANWNKILANLLSKVMGYTDAYKGLFLVLENSDVTGVIESQMTNGYSFADAALNNGLILKQAGIDIFVTRDSTFTNGSGGNTSWSNSGHRVFGVKGVATYAAPRGIQYAEKDVTAKTGKEVVVWGYIGFKLWTPKAGLIVDITVTS
jgi:hypothetical protein